MKKRKKLCKPKKGEYRCKSKRERPRTDKQIDFHKTYKKKKKKEREVKREEYGVGGVSGNNLKRNYILLIGRLVSETKKLDLLLVIEV